MLLRSGRRLRRKRHLHPCQRPPTVMAEADPNIQQEAPQPENNGAEVNQGQRQDARLVHQELQRIVNRMQNMTVGNDIIPPQFYGKEDEIPTRWLRKFDAYVVLKQFDNIQRLNIFSLLMSGEAERWYTSLPDDLANNWENMRAAFIGRFQNRAPQWRIDQELRTIKQMDKETIEKYASRLRDMCYRYNRNDNELFSLFLQGLIPSIRSTVVNRDPVNFQEAVAFARTAEVVERFDDDVKALKTGRTSDTSTEVLQQAFDSLLKQNEVLHEKLSAAAVTPLPVPAAPVQIRQEPYANAGPRSRVGQSYNYSNVNRPPVVTPRYGGRQVNTAKQICKFCNKPGHSSPNCYANPDRGCYNCGEIGHVARFCDRNGARYAFPKNG